MNYVTVAKAMERFKLAEPITLEDMAYIAGAMRTQFPGVSVEVFRHVDAANAKRLKREIDPITVHVAAVVFTVQPTAS